MSKVDKTFAHLQAELARGCKNEYAGSTGLCFSTGKDLYRQAKLVFSAKESLYKCLWPILKSFIGFREVSITLFEQDRSWTATSHTDQCPTGLIARVQGRYLLTEKLIISSACFLPDD